MQNHISTKSVSIYVGSKGEAGAFELKFNSKITITDNSNSRQETREQTTPFANKNKLLPTIYAGLVVLKTQIYIVGEVLSLSLTHKTHKFFHTSSMIKNSSFGLDPGSQLGFVEAGELLPSLDRLPPLAMVLLWTSKQHYLSQWQLQ